MGMMLRFKSSTSSDNSLPKVQIPYGGLTDGLTLACHLRHSLALSRDQSGHGATLTPIGNPIFDQYCITGTDGSGLKTNVPSPASADCTFFVVARRKSGTVGHSFFIGNYFQNPINRGRAILWNADTGLRVQINKKSGSPVFSDTAFTDAGISEDEWFFIAVTINQSLTKATVYIPGKKYQKSATWATPLENGSSDFLEIAQQSNYAGEGPSNVAYVAYFSRSLSDEEVTMQYASAQSYCNDIGIHI